jgi:type VI secretion system secreted protein VgrG
MPNQTQANRPMAVTSPLGADVLLLVGFAGEEGLSRLFSFRLDLLAELKTDIAFDKLIGQPVGVRLDLLGGAKRFFHGICVRFSQGASDDAFTEYEMEIVPSLWLLSKRVQSRIFQQKSVPDILKEVLKGLDVTWEIQGTFQPRDYCVQYRESDYDFASRLMEEEGIYYFFKHAEGGHKMVVANTPKSHPDVPGKTEVLFTLEDQTSIVGPDIIKRFGKTQELTPGKYTLWDHSFELPHKHLEAEKAVPDSVKVGQVTHKLAVGNNGKLEVYDWPGAYAQRFDGVDPGGGGRAGDLGHIFEDNKRTVEIRQKQGTLPAILIRGAGGARQMVSGHKFSIATNAGDPARQLKAEGAYVLTSLTHDVKLPDFRSGKRTEFAYANEFECIPADFPFTPPQVTPKPSVAGSQTAVVVGPAGEEIFTDQYSRVKVQFHWDRQGKNDANSSCWIRVVTYWAGKQWGFIHIPRIGQEVVVDFLEGDPDQPIVVGSVYNAEQMPPYPLPGNKTQSGVKSRSSLGGSPANFNEIRFEDKKGSELLTVHAEKDQSISVEHDEAHSVGNDRAKTVGNNEKTAIGNNRDEKVGNNETILIGANRTEEVKANETITIDGNRGETVKGNETIAISGNRDEKVGGNETIAISGNRDEKVGGNETIAISGSRSETVTGSETIAISGSRSETVKGSETIAISGGRNESVGGSHDELVKAAYGLMATSIVLMARASITLTTGGATIEMTSGGDINITGSNITINGSSNIKGKAGGNVSFKGSQIKQN